MPRMPGLEALLSFRVSLWVSFRVFQIGVPTAVPKPFVRVPLPNIFCGL